LLLLKISLISSMGYMWRWTEEEANMPDRRGHIEL